MHIEYEKLVRDRIPAIIRGEGKQYEIRTLSNSEYRRALRKKLVEEAREAACSSEADLASELGDLLEVVDAIAKAYDIDQTTVQDKRIAKRLERGGFDKRIELLWV